MTIERAIQILDPEHREHYESLEPVNEACRMGMEALREKMERESLEQQLELAVSELEALAKSRGSCAGCVSFGEDVPEELSRRCDSCRDQSGWKWRGA